MRGATLAEARRLFEVCTEMMDTVQAMPQPVCARVHALATAEESVMSQPSGARSTQASSKAAKPWMDLAAMVRIGPAATRLTRFSIRCRKNAVPKSDGMPQKTTRAPRSSSAGPL